jgi:hypothetical protein
VIATGQGVGPIGLLLLLPVGVVVGYFVGRRQVT